MILSSLYLLVLSFPLTFASVADLLGNMTLEEKIGQLNLLDVGDVVTGLSSNLGIARDVQLGRVGGVFNIQGITKIYDTQKLAMDNCRIPVPLLFGMDVIHGYRTVYPIPLAIACSFDRKLIENLAEMAAREATADGICWTFSPMVDISRDPRWGRIAEGSGEDPYLGAEIARAHVIGYQGSDDGTIIQDGKHMLACVKHYAFYGAAEAGRDYNTVDMSRIRMFNEYFPPYKAGCDAGAATVMASFNELDGVPAHGNAFLLDTVLRKFWDFQGFVVSDYTGIKEMIAHGIGDMQACSVMGIKAGMDMDMVSAGYIDTLEKSVHEGKVDETIITESARRILNMKEKLGLLANPYLYCDPTRAKDIFTDENRALAKTAAAESCVLLKNSNEKHEAYLPLPTADKTIALIGPLADAKNQMTGTWSGTADAEKGVSLLTAMRMKTADWKTIKVVHAMGSNVVDDAELERIFSVFSPNIFRDNRPASVIREEAIEVAKSADIIVAALGELADMSGEASSRSEIDIPKTQRDLLEALLALGKPLVLVLFNGRALTIEWEVEHVDSILEAWHPGLEGTEAICDLLFGTSNPCGKLCVSFPKRLGQVPIYYGRKPTGRPAPKKWQKFVSNYLDVDNDPTFAFGHGLSYTQFSYSDLVLSDHTMPMDEAVQVNVTVKNVGSRAGKEVVQLYIRDVYSSVTRPVKELKGFEKIHLDAGESKIVSFTLTKKDLGYYYNSEDYTAKPYVGVEFKTEPGEYKVFVGGNSVDTLEDSFVVLEQK